MAIESNEIVEKDEHCIYFTRSMGKFRERSSCFTCGYPLSTEYIENDSKKYYNRGNEPNYIFYALLAGGVLICHRWLNSDGEPHREDGPAEIRFDINGNVRSESYMINGEYQQRGILPNDIKYNRTLNGDIESYCHLYRDSDGMLYREDDGPTAITFRPDGTVLKEQYEDDYDFE